MSFEEIDERYHDAALDDVGEAWPEDASSRAPAAADGDRRGAVPAEREGVDPAGGPA